MLNSEFFPCVIKSRTGFISYQFIHRHPLKWLSGSLCISFLPSTQCMIQVFLCSIICSYYISRKAVILNGWSAADLQLSTDWVRGSERKQMNAWKQPSCFPVQSSRRAFRSQQIHQRHKNIEYIPQRSEKKLKKNSYLWRIMPVSQGF